RSDRTRSSAAYASARPSPASGSPSAEGTARRCGGSGTAITVETLGESPTLLAARGSTMRYPVRRAGSAPVIREELLEAVRAALAAAGCPEPAGGGGLETPKQRDHGDWSTNAALAVAKPAGIAPREAADRIKVALERKPWSHLESVAVAGPGFLNFRVAPSG